MTLEQAYILTEEEETKKRRNKEFSKTLEDNYSKTFVKNIERIVNQIIDEHRNDDFKLFGLPTN